MIVESEKKNVYFILSSGFDELNLTARLVILSLSKYGTKEKFCLKYKVIATGKGDGGKTK
ncbi:MAG TPA: hypothetical protein PKK00_02820 [Bacteroidales bacterium]|nr:hypothetical protein [Bacteroidales bacterium]HPS16406.1 hypothetical protein [Bacteroidales bacterium]